MLLPFPGSEIRLPFQFFLKVFIDGVEKVITCDFLNFVYAHGRALHRLVFGVVVIDEGYAAFLALVKAKQGLEELSRHGDAMLYLAGLLV